MVSRIMTTQHTIMSINENREKCRPMLFIGAHIVMQKRDAPYFSRYKGTAYERSLNLKATTHKYGAFNLCASTLVSLTVFLCVLCVYPCLFVLLFLLALVVFTLQWVFVP